MARFFSFCFLLVILASCHSSNGVLVSIDQADSLVAHFAPPSQWLANEQEMNFWKQRMDARPDGLVNEIKYANTLVTRFQARGDIHDLKQADSLVQRVNERYRMTETSQSLTLAHYAMLQHRFVEAHQRLQHASDLGGKKYALLLASFDAYLELGMYDSAVAALYTIRNNKDFNYFFRLSKWQHLNGSADSALGSMLKAAKYADNDPELKQAALSNAADLCIHTGDLVQAKALYDSCIHLNAADFHSLSGLAWIALVHDHQPAVAEKLYHLISEQLKSPDALLKLSQLEGARNNVAAQKNWASLFAAQAGNAIYGNMYNKYLIDCYTGVLGEYDKAELLARKEILNRATPQTYAWLAWSLACNNKTEEAFAVFQQHVSGQPLESMELYWMGQLMQKLKKGYNASQFFDAAYKNQYDFPPQIQMQIKRALN